MTRCQCGNARKGGTFTPDQCRLCWVQLNQPEVARAWQSPPRSLPCVFLGDVRDRLGCPCPAKWVRGCSIHSDCTLERCKVCEDYEPAG